LGLNDTTQQTQRTFARANLLRTCYGETGVMDFGLYAAQWMVKAWNWKQRQSDTALKGNNRR